MFQTIPVHGVAVNVSGNDQALQELDALVQSNGRHYVCFFEGNMLRWAWRCREIRDVLNGAALCYPDGIAPAKLASWALGRNVSRVSGPTFLLKACEYGVSRGWRHYFLGGKEGVAEELSRKMQARYPGLQVAGTWCPPFREMTPEEMERLCRELQEKRVDLLWVALGGPRQEQWMHRYQGRMPVPVMLGVGAAFDFHTAHQAWAPAWMRRCGLEWLWRMSTGGRRVFWRNLSCVSLVMLILLGDFFCRLKYLFCSHPSLQEKSPR